MWDPRHDHQASENQSSDVRDQNRRAPGSELWSLSSEADKSLDVGPRHLAVRVPCSLRVVVPLISKEMVGLGVIKPIERLVLVSCTCCHASTSSLSTWWSSTALKRDLVSRGVSRLDAFSGYPVRT